LRVILLLWVLSRVCGYIFKSDYTFDILSGVDARFLPVYEGAYVRGRRVRRHGRGSKGAASGPRMTSYRLQHLRVLLKEWCRHGVAVHCLAARCSVS
jgi:hypothetical protein